MLGIGIFLWDVNENVGIIFTIKLFLSIILIRLKVLAMIE